jgi:hypothetical protein
MKNFNFKTVKILNFFIVKVFLIKIVSVDS